MEKKTRINLERQITKGTEYPLASNQVQTPKRFHWQRLGPSGFKDIHGLVRSCAKTVHFNQLFSVRSLAHEKEHSLLAPVEYEDLTLPDTDRIFLYGFEHLIRTPAPITLARLTPAL